ncbi:unnamed protein product [Camellia sinensis]
MEGIGTFPRYVRHPLRNLWQKTVKKSSSSSSTLQSSSSSILQSSSSSGASLPGKFVCICVYTVDKYEWYTFDVSDDIRHNQTPPPAKYINYAVPFHDDDESGLVNLKPKVTANMDWILGWSILGLTLYVLDDWTGDWRGSSIENESNRVDRIDLGSTRSKWERVPQMPNQIAALAHTFVLAGKFYCLGGFRLKKGELERESPLAMAYDLSVKAGDSLPSAPCINLDEIFSGAKEVPNPCFPSQKMDLERLSLRDNKSSLDEEGPNPCLPSQKIDLERPLSFPVAPDDSLFGSTWLEISPAGEELSNSYSQNMELERQKPWVMAYNQSLNTWESLPDPPSCPVKVDSIFSAAGEFPNPCIVVGSPGDGLQIYQVNTKKWEKQEFKICPKFGPNVLTGPALAVDGKLYWYSDHDLSLVGYDLVTSMWFVGNFPIHDHGEHFGVRDVDTPPRLAHLGGDMFCLLWVSVLPRRRMQISESKDDYISRLHCMKLQVTAENFHPVNGIIPLEVSILSCQSYLASGLKFFGGGLVVFEEPLRLSKEYIEPSCEIQLHKKAIPFLKISAAQAISEEHLPPSDSSIISPRSRSSHNFKVLGALQMLARHPSLLTLEFLKNVFAYYLVDMRLF